MLSKFMNLEKIPNNGGKYTWNNNQTCPTIPEKLDRVEQGNERICVLWKELSRFFGDI